MILLVHERGRQGNEGRTSIKLIPNSPTFPHPRRHHLSRNLQLQPIPHNLPTLLYSTDIIINQSLQMKNENGGKSFEKDLFGRFYAESGAGDEIGEGFGDC